MSESNDKQVEQPKAGELPPFDWKRMEEIAADPLCEEHDFREYCAACLAIEGARWALKMRGALLAEQQVSAGLRIELDTCAEKNKKLVKNNDKLVELVNEACDLGEAAEASLAEMTEEIGRLHLLEIKQFDRAKKAEASLAEAKLKIANLESQLNLKKGSD